MTKVLARTVGRRKSAVARVHLESGKGAIIINRRDIDDYFHRVTYRKLLLEPLEAVDVVGQYDIVASVRGGGLSGQAGALSLAIARALEKVNEDFRLALKQGGYLTRDAREVERKKYGQPGARKRFQFSKR
ncbi:MAG: 30S ribosomal protein S9 [Fidelibacterota bacterium]|nr:MAG: 30S ribosomal protein S9 [Candidatus Neomarinimicrobiota bacterium]